MSLDHRLLNVLVAHAFCHRITASDAEAGLAILAAGAPARATVEEWRDAVSAALHQRLISDPVCLPAGALQCCWRLLLTAQGIEVARRQTASQGH